MSELGAIFDQAVATWKACRADYADYLEAAYVAAETETGGQLVNELGKSRGVDPFTLFSGTEVRALAYASPELLDYWARRPRMSFSEYETQWCEGAA